MPEPIDRREAEARLAEAKAQLAAVRALAEKWRNAKTWADDPDIVSFAYGTLLLETLDGEKGSQS